VDYPHLELECDEIEVSDARYLDVITKPWFSDRDVYISADQGAIPSPDYWVQSLKGSGLEVGFRYLGGPLIQPENVPYPDYSGYFLQAVNLIPSTQYGVFLMSVKHADGRTKVALQNHNDGNDEIMNAMLRMLSDWTNLEVRSGNVHLQGPEAATLLRTQKLPDRLARLA
jgi:hypothetical protein